MGYFYITLTVLFTVYGQLIIKQQVNTIESLPAGFSMIPFFMKFIFTRPLVLSGFISAFLASISWMAAISRFELSYAYPFMSLNFVIVIVLSATFFGESINWFKILGVAFICLGIFLTAKGG
jgi:drug/metabolite transporter (DMT)-like permease